MNVALSKIAGYMLTKFLTEKFLGKVTIIILEYLSAKSTNKVDDEIVKVIKEALGQ